VIRSGRSATPAALSLTGAVAVSLTLIPLIAAPALTGHGGGYTIDQWGFWAAATVVASGVLLAMVRHTQLSGVQRLFPISLFGLALWSFVSISWAHWPQSALVEADRYLFYACTALLVLAAPFTAGRRRVLVGLVGAAAAVPALLLALRLWHSTNTASLFDAGRLVGNVGYAGGLAAAVAVGFWPLVAVASDRTVPRVLRPLSAAAAGVVLATVVPTEARASLWAVALSAVVFLALCPTPIRSGAIAAAALLPTFALWNDLNSVFSSAGAVGGHTVGRAVLLVGLAAGLGGAFQVGLDEVVTLGEPARRALMIAGVVWVCLMTAGAIAAVLVVTNGHPLAAAGRTLRHTVNSVGTGQQAAAQGEAASRFGSLDTGRYELWRVALRGFRDRPAEGFGAGNFGYLNVRIGRPFLFPYQAHSQLLEVASTLGVPGIALYLLALGVPFAACLWVRRSALPRPEQLTAAGAGGSLAYFAIHGQVDWIWQLASCALPAVLLAGAVVGMLPGGREHRRSAVTGWTAAAAGLAAALVLIVPAALAETYLQRSYTEPAPQALRDASRAADFDRLSGRPDLARARALLRTGDAAGALAAARAAAGAEPGFWVAWQMLAVVAAREGQTPLAILAQRRVAQLAPRLPLELRGTIPNAGFDHY
jgi:hypothetical protein